jgi:hypothetical protein
LKVIDMFAFLERVSLHIVVHRGRCPCLAALRDGAETHSDI